MEMKNKYKVFFGLKKDPFAPDIDVKNILPTPQLQGAVERFEYSIQIGAVYLITGEIGSGKSTKVVLPTVRQGWVFRNAMVSR